MPGSEEIRPKPEWLVRRQCREQGLEVRARCGIRFRGSPFVIEIRGGPVTVEWDAFSGDFSGTSDELCLGRPFARDSNNARAITAGELGGLKAFFDLCEPSEVLPQLEYAEKVHAALQDRSMELFRSHGRMEGSPWCDLESLRKDVGWALTALPDRKTRFANVLHRLRETAARALHRQNEGDWWEFAGFLRTLFRL
jgi:hypothetical protein